MADTSGRTKLIAADHSRLHGSCRTRRHGYGVQLANEPSWNELAKVLNQAAKETCGVKKRNAANLWTVGQRRAMKWRIRQLERN